MKKKIKYIIVILSIGFVISCTKDFIQKDITKDLVNIIAPVDNFNTPNNTITFWWDELEGAEKYNLQIVKPNFDSISQLLVDTMITGDKFVYTFYPGSYQWRIKALNGGGSTEYITRKLIIDTTSNLQYVQVNPIAPVINYKTNSKTIVFSWNPLPSALSYNLIIYDATGQIASFNTANVMYQYTFANTGVFSWKIQAQNSFSYSQFSTLRFLKIDQTSPSTPNQLTPSNNSLLMQDSLKWSRSSQDVMYDSLFISSDSFASTIRSIYVNNTFYQISNVSPALSNNNFYFWRLKSIDSAGNRSSFSSIRKFKLIP
ncbi:MAG: hypothetical protein C0448_14450 [Sphingobacteriaceae bacterium]|nr:hypothetical protein [Sphingobacteriaceae bacterium]